MRVYISASAALISASVRRCGAAIRLSAMLPLPRRLKSISLFLEEAAGGIPDNCVQYQSQKIRNGFTVAIAYVPLLRDQRFCEYRSPRCARSGYHWAKARKAKALANNARSRPGAGAGLARCIFLECRRRQFQDVRR